GAPIDKIGYYGITTFNLTFDGLRVPADGLLGGRASADDAPRAAGRAFNATMHGLNIARIHTAARAIGLARGALEDSIKYAVERYWRDARLTTIFEGTSEIQRVIISDRLLGRAR